MPATQDLHSAYYNKGSEEVARETPLTLKKLEKRRDLTRNSERLVIALVGLPARGKSFISRKLRCFLLWSGHKCRIFNVGKYRREAVAEIAKEKEENGLAEPGSCDADFFDANNKEASELRERVAELALHDMLRWLDGDDEETVTSSQSRRSGDSTQLTDVMDHKLEGDRIAIFDATNSTQKRRAWILEECTSPLKRAGKPTGVVFVESICDDEELLRENYKFKISSCPDFFGMTEKEALEDLSRRVSKYEDQYETITDDSQSYIKIFNLSSKILVNHIYGRMAKTIVPAIMAWNVGTRPVFLCRPGKTPHNVRTDGEDYIWRIEENTLDVSAHSGRRFRGEKLGAEGISFRSALADYVACEATDFMLQQQAIASHPSLFTGTSQTGLSSFKNEVGLDGRELPFPLVVLTSTMPRAVDTVLWEDVNFPVSMNSHLNPLDKGDFAGMELDEISEVDPTWYSRLANDPFCTRFPGGESYRDLITRLESVIIDVEQQIKPVLVVSHVSVLQGLIAYFRQSPVDQCTSIEVPMHTVIKFTPSRGGGWMESRIPLQPEEDSYQFGSIHSPRRMENVTSESELSALTCSEHVLSSTPIWGDHMGLRCKRTFSS